MLVLQSTMCPNLFLPTVAPFLEPTVNVETSRLGGTMGPGRSRWGSCIFIRGLRALSGSGNLFTTI